jgi:hypothetical protein
MTVVVGGRHPEHLARMILRAQSAQRLGDILAGGLPTVVPGSGASAGTISPTVVGPTLIEVLSADPTGAGLVMGRAWVGGGGVRWGSGARWGDGHRWGGRTLRWFDGGAIRSIATQDQLDLYIKKSLLTAKGQLLARGAADVLALGAGTSGYVLSADPTTASGLAWVPATGGGGTTGAPLLPLDTGLVVGSGDLFAGTVLDGGWSDLQATAVTSKDRSVDGYLVLRNTGNTAGQDRGVKRAFSPGGDFEVRCRLNEASCGVNFQWGGLFIGATDPSDAGGANRLSCFVLQNGGDSWKAAKYAAGVETNVFAAVIGSNAALAHIQFPLWLRIRRVGSTISFGISEDGVKWIDHTTTTTIAYTVNTCGLLIGESSATADIRATFDWITAG